MSCTRHVLASLCALLAVLAAGCASQQQIRDAMVEVNKAFQADYERILAEQGTRGYKVRRSEAFVALHSALSRLGMRIESQEPEVGYLNVFAPAPSPLDAQEWRRAAEADLPRMRELACPIIGPTCQFISFEPEGLQIVINATVLETAAGCEISLTTRMRETAPPKSGLPRREYPPPTGVRMALVKIWAQFEQELRLAGKLS